MLTTKKGENAIYLLIWLIVLGFPLLNIRSDLSFNWTKLWIDWIRIVPFIILFAINNFWIAPSYLFKKRIQYWILISVAIILITFCADFTKIFRDLLVMDPMNPDEQLREMRPSPHHDPSILPRMFDRIIFSYLIIGFNIAIKMMFKRQEDEKNNEKLQKMHLQTELAFLRQQVSPHFFMNTLNNIHALIDLDSKQAQDAVIKLSKMMRYLLEDSKQGISTVREEFDFLNSYIDLMKIRYPERVKINLEFNIPNPERKIHSLLFISLVENAFKYGINPNEGSLIEIQALIVNEKLQFTVKNGIFSEHLNNNQTRVGIENLKKQLTLIYESNYNLELIENNNTFQAQLTIPFEK
ncbi:MAG: sensor histidine kinase [Bacteroidetes bacterium]|nr:sensor histidine kinase [Bacteroidota bacterium]